MNVAQRIEKGCTRKRTHETKSEAKAQCKKFRRTTGRRMWVYECHWCGQWHTTTQKTQRGERP